MIVLWIILGMVVLWLLFCIGFALLYYFFYRHTDHSGDMGLAVLIMPIAPFAWLFFLPSNIMGKIRMAKRRRNKRRKIL